MTSIPRPGATTTPATEAYWAAAAEGRLLLQRCDRCGHRQLYPRTLCSHCWSDRLGWQEASGLGTVWTFTVVHQPGHPAWVEDSPYVLAVVELDEGPRMTTNIVGVQPDSVHVGQLVRVTRDDPLNRSGPPTVVFAPSDP